MAVGCGGKFGAMGLFATRKWALGGKQSVGGRFATRIKLEEPVATLWLLVVVANLELWVYLPPESGLWVANRVSEADLPPE